jgi:hypothetical protein
MFMMKLYSKLFHNLFTRIFFVHGYSLLYHALIMQPLSNFNKCNLGWYLPHINHFTLQGTLILSCKYAVFKKCDRDGHFLLAKHRYILSVRRLNHCYNKLNTSKMYWTETQHNLPTVHLPAHTNTNNILRKIHEYTT